MRLQTCCATRPHTCCRADEHDQVFPTQHVHLALCRCESRTDITLRYPPIYDEVPELAVGKGIRPAVLQKHFQFVKQEDLRCTKSHQRSCEHGSGPCALNINVLVRPMAQHGTSASSLRYEKAQNKHGHTSLELFAEVTVGQYATSCLRRFPAHAGSASKNATSHKDKGLPKRTSQPSRELLCRMKPVSVPVCTFPVYSLLLLQRPILLCRRQNA